MNVSDFVHLKGRPLDDKQLEALHWASRGKTVAETATIVGCSSAKIRYHLELSRVKLDTCNVTHTVAKALVLDLIKGER